jgi:hypothetical protein
LNGILRSLHVFWAPIALLYTTTVADTFNIVDRTQYPALSKIYSMTSSSESYASASLKSPPSHVSRHSNDSDDSLRALELSEGPILAGSFQRGRSYSISGFDFQHDLLPLSASLSEPEGMHGESTEKSLGLVNGMCSRGVFIIPALNM